jgi:putative transposase
VKGRKRHILVDTQGFIIRVLCHPANVPDRRAAKPLLLRLKGYAQCLKAVMADGAYTGDLAHWLCQHLAVPLLIAQARPDPLSKRRHHPTRWVVERTFAWLGFQRRLVVDYEVLPAVSETFVTLAAINLLVHRLHPQL